MISQRDNNYHGRHYYDLTMDIEDLYRKKLLTTKAYILILRVIINDPRIRDVPISYHKEQLVSKFNVDCKNFSRDYKCLSTYNIWKKIGSRYVINPRLVFSGKIYWEEISFNYWEKGKLFTSDDKIRIIKANKHK